MSRKTWIIITTIIVIVSVFIFPFGSIAEYFNDNKVAGITPNTLFGRYTYFTERASMIEDNKNLYKQASEIMKQTENGDYSNISMVDYKYFITGGNNGSRVRTYSLHDMTSYYYSTCDNHMAYYNHRITFVDYCFINSILLFSGKKLIPLRYPDNYILN